MSLIEQEFDEYDKNNSWPFIYQRLKNESSVAHLEVSFNDARKAENRNRNRYRDVSPYDHSRIILCKGDNDYINASLIEAPEAQRKYILTQGPLEHTCSHFWQMVWEQNSRAVVMLNRVIEKGSAKCHQYWPLGVFNGNDETLVFNDVGLKVTLAGEKQLTYFIQRTLLLEEIETSKTREVYHFHYVTWPDFGVPQSPSAFLNFLLAVRQSGALDTDVGPPIVHCSAGIGRSGTFCLVDTCLVMIEQTSDMSDIDVKQILTEMRYYRMGLIQTPDQLRFSYLAIIEGAHRILSGGLGTADDLAMLENNNDETVAAHLSLFDDSDDDDDDEDDEEFNLDDDDDDMPDLRIVEEEDEEEDIPPPLPPRQSKPLMENGLTNLDSDDLTASEGDRLIPAEEEEEYENVTHDVPPFKDVTDVSETEIRRRKREDRVKNTKKQLEDMRKKQRESERWKKGRHPWYLQPVYLGLAAILVGGYLFYKWYW